MRITIACLGEWYNLHRDEGIVDQFAAFSLSPKTNLSELTYKSQDQDNASIVVIILEMMWQCF